MKLSSANINVMVKACRKASKILIRDFGEIEKLQVSPKGPGDFVTVSDKKVEKILIDELQRARPDYSILSEEIGLIKKDEEFKWIIDPIDGTANFLHGIPHFGISIGLEHNKEIICGIIYDPIKNEMFFAEKGNGSYLNDQRMRVSARSKLMNCIIFTGGPSFKSNDEDKKLSLKEYEKFSSRKSFAKKEICLGVVKYSKSKLASFKLKFKLLISSSKKSNSFSNNLVLFFTKDVKINPDIRVINIKMFLINANPFLLSLDSS